MDIAKCLQFHLYLLTLHMLKMKNLSLPQNCDMRCVNATFINRSYYSAYLYCVLWFEDTKRFKPVSSWEFNEDERKISKHQQIRNALYNFNEPEMGSKLNQLFDSRFKVDYGPFIDILPEEVDMAIKYMEYIFNNLKFE